MSKLSTFEKYWRGQKANHKKKLPTQPTQPTAAAPQPLENQIPPEANNDYPGAPAIPLDVPSRAVPHPDRNEKPQLEMVTKDDLMPKYFPEGYRAKQIEHAARMAGAAESARVEVRRKHESELKRPGAHGIKARLEPRSRRRKALTDAEKRTRKIRALLRNYRDNQRPTLDQYGGLLEDKVAPPPRCRRHDHKTFKTALACMPCRRTVSAEYSRLWVTRHQIPELERTA